MKKSPEDAGANFEGVNFAIPQSMCSGVMDGWLERMTEYINAEGGFIGKLDELAGQFCTKASGTNSLNLVSVVEKVWAIKAKYGV